MHQLLSPLLLRERSTASHVRAKRDLTPTEHTVVEKRERSGHAAEGPSQYKPLGDWTTINHIQTDETGSVDYGYDTTTLKRPQDDSASARDRVEGNRTRTFEFHTKLTLDKQTLD